MTLVRRKLLDTPIFNYFLGSQSGSGTSSTLFWLQSLGLAYLQLQVLAHIIPLQVYSI
jgi:hypothetical protein